MSHQQLAQLISAAMEAVPVTVAQVPPAESQRPSSLTGGQCRAAATKLVTKFGHNSARTSCAANMLVLEKVMARIKVGPKLARGVFLPSITLLTLLIV